MPPSKCFHSVTQYIISPNACSAEITAVSQRLECHGVEGWVKFMQNLLLEHNINAPPLEDFDGMEDDDVEAETQAESTTQPQASSSRPAQPQASSSRHAQPQASSSRATQPQASSSRATQPQASRSRGGKKPPSKRDIAQENTSKILRGKYGK